MAKAGVKPGCCRYLRTRIFMLGVKIEASPLSITTQRFFSCLLGEQHIIFSEYEIILRCICRGVCIVKMMNGTFCIEEKQLGKSHSIDAPARD